MNYELKAAFHTLGCKVNSYETQAIKEQFLALGFKEAGFDEPADVYVINTCSVTQVAERKSRQMISRARKLSPAAVIAATGCYAQEDAKKLIADGNVDLVIGNNEKSRLAGIALKKLEEKRKYTAKNVGNEAKQGENEENTSEEVYKNTENDAVYVADMTRCKDYEELKISSAGEHTRAYIKIQDGCNRFCSYCMIPYLRGRSRCRKAADIIPEAKTLAANGYKEIVLTGIDISDFEEEGHKKGDESLLYLIKEISKITGIKRIRLGSLECSVITDAFLEGVSRTGSFCPQFHLSLQSGSDSVLKRMNRKYTPDEYYEKVCLIRKYFPDAAITTDIIVGFPGETDEEFKQTCEFVKKVAFSRVHVFKYSKRKGTRAASLPGQVDGNIKNARSGQLIKITDELQKEYEEKFIGRKVCVLFEEKTKGGFYTGYTPEYVRAAAFGDEDITGKILNIVPEKIGRVKEDMALISEIFS